MNHIRFIRLKNFPDRLQADTVLMRSPPWRQPSIQGRARHSNGKRPQRHLTNFSDRPTNSPLRRPLDSALAAALAAMDEPAAMDRPPIMEGLLQRIEHEARMCCP